MGKTLAATLKTIMRRYEKIILIVFTFAFVLQLLAFPGKSALFALSTWLVSLSYLFGGYWLFNTIENKNVALSITSGIAMSISFFFLPNLVWCIREQYYNFLPIANGLLFIALGIYLFLNRKSETNFQIIKSIFLRSLIVLIITTPFYIHSNIIQAISKNALCSKQWSGSYTTKFVND